MSESELRTWHEANQRYLVTALAVLREILEGKGQSAGQELEAAASEMPSPPALETLSAAFGLSAFERNVLLASAGLELDSRFGTLCASAQDDPRRTYLTFSLALAAFPDAHWSAISPSAPLRYWRLIEVGSGDSLTTSPLRVDERILHYLTGVWCFDERLRGVVERLRAPEELPPSHDSLAREIASTWSGEPGPSVLPVVQLCGSEAAAKRAVAAAACALAGLESFAISAGALPQVANELETFMRLWEREAALCARGLVLDCDDTEPSEVTGESTIARLIEGLRCAVIVASRGRRHSLQRPMIAFDVEKPTPSEQRATWQRSLGAAAARLNGKLDALVAQFNLGEQSILTAGADAARRVDTEALADNLWDFCRAQARPRMEDLAHRIAPTATWDDLVLPEPQRQTLREVAMHVRQRFRVYESWGFASKGTRGLGISALFSGVSGTGKTMAAEVLAHDLRLDLYRIDLSRVVSKYIGETEKNLRKVFDAAEEGGAILLFDEADALFGKRSEVKDSHDRYANIEISYLLQRMEAYRGLAILATNVKSALDSAFLRRIRFVVQFPFPDSGQRAEIWRNIFPRSTPTEGLDTQKLARLNVAGGNIRNIALNAAFLAADAGEPVRMTHLLRAARAEYSKLEKALTEAETGGWR
jgi:ATP-dependent 26S proteasome regulatory subunit